ncbi:MAG: hypothetical protein KC478_11245, partial [Bacteriovoracaceae bacterium]|nr:hypothetical protein [Bacteriovoracaceae bacterium]
MKNFSFKTKLILAFCLSGLIPLGSVGYYAYQKSSESLQEEAVNKLVAVRNIKGEAVKRYFNSIADQVITFADDVMIKDAMIGFRDSFKSFNVENEINESKITNYKASLREFYINEFASKYNKENQNQIDVAPLLDSLSDTEIALQYHYISRNPAPLGNKHELKSANDGSTYSKLHAKYHPSIAKYLEKFGYYDIFLVDIDSGNIVYSVFKELDYATSLSTGSYSSTNFSEVFQKAKSLNDKNSYVLVDFKQYTPSYEAPASFIGAPIFDGDKKVGVLIFQMPIDRINAVMSERSGMGKTGETYIFGSDQLMRSDSFLDSENRSVVNSFKKPSTGKLNSVPANKALQGESGNSVAKNYLGQEVISAFTPIEILGMKWGLIAEITTDEAFAPVVEIKNTMLIATGICFVCLLLLAILMSSKLAKDLASKVSAVAQRLSSTAENVGQASYSVLGTSTQLSEAATQQASSLQETVSSIDEISSMVQKNAESAENSTSMSDRSNQAALRGKETVGSMINSINDIAEGNQNIAAEIKRNNDEISKVVELIGEIGEKTKIINDIVFQTKLLSFNASVEAARAGEHGKGFAVVAEEVGSLAAMSGKAALEITDMLDGSIKQVEDIVDTARDKVEVLMAKSQKNVDQGTKTANECESALDEILQNVASVNEMVREIASAS